MSKKKKVIKMENTVNGVFDALYDLSTRVDLQAEKILELQKQRDEFKIFIESNIIAKGFESIEIENLAKKLIKKYKS